MTPAVFTLHRGRGPLLVSVPHAGTLIPEDQQARYVPRALAVEDADWHVDEVYGFARERGASLLVPRYARYLVDLNRPPDDQPMYPGANNTSLCPVHDFTGAPLYRTGAAPDRAEVDRRRATYWAPYQEALAAELDRLRAVHGHAVLLDAHSIQPVLPWLFEGRLPDLNLGTADGRSCAPGLRERLAEVLRAHPQFTHAVDGRFKGGHITRHHGRPADGLHAVQMEMAWSCYLDDNRPPDRPDRARRARLQPVLQALVRTLMEWRPHA